MNNSTVGEAIKNARKIYGDTLEELGKKVGVSHAFLSKIENNKVTPTNELIDKICKVIDPTNNLSLRSEIYILLGEYDEINPESELFQRLLREGKIEFDFGNNNNFRILNKPYNNLTYLLESENGFVFDIKGEPYEKSALTIKVPGDLQFKIHKAINRLVLDHILDNPELIKSFDENNQHAYKEERENKFKRLNELLGEGGENGESYEALAYLLNSLRDDSYLL